MNKITKCQITRTHLSHFKVVSNGWRVSSFLSPFLCFPIANWHRHCPDRKSTKVSSLSRVFQTDFDQLFVSVTKSFQSELSVRVWCHQPTSLFLALYSFLETQGCTTTTTSESIKLLRGFRYTLPVSFCRFPGAWLSLLIVASGHFRRYVNLALLSSPLSVVVLVVLEETGSSSCRNSCVCVWVCVLCVMTIEEELRGASWRWWWIFADVMDSNRTSLALYRSILDYIHNWPKYKG